MLNSVFFLFDVSLVKILAGFFCQKFVPKIRNFGSKIDLKLKFPSFRLTYNFLKLRLIFMLDTLAVILKDFGNSGKIFLYF